MRNAFLILLALLTSVANASHADRLNQLLTKKTQSELSQAESKELDALIDAAVSGKLDGVGTQPAASTPKSAGLPSVAESQASAKSLPETKAEKQAPREPLRDRDAVAAESKRRVMSNKLVSLGQVQAQPRAQEKRQAPPSESGKFAPNSAAGIYHPITNTSMAPTRKGIDLAPDSSQISVVQVSTRDSVTVLSCIASGISILFDETIDTEIQRVVIDDDTYFNYVELDNKRGVFVRLVKPVPDGSFADTALHLFRKKDDQEYLINLIGVPCPNGPYPYPKVIYLRDRNRFITRNSAPMTPEDTIISYSKGYPRVNKHSVHIYDMAASSGSDWVVLGVEASPRPGEVLNPADMKFISLDHLQVNVIDTKAKYMDVPSKTISGMKKKQVLRFNLTVNLNKAYITRYRYSFLIYLNEKTKHYQYIRVDTLKLFESLQQRNFEL